jgi:predicted nucleotidyltransferase
LWKTQGEWSGREIARQTGLSATHCHLALKELDARGLAIFRPVSKVHLYKINADNYMVRRVFSPFFEAEKAIPKEIDHLILKTLVQRHAPIEIISLVLFGSMARGTERLESDLDLLVVVPSQAAKEGLEPNLEKLRSLLAREFNIPFSPYVQTLAEIREKHRKKLPVVENIIKQGRCLYGKDLKELLS